MNFPHVSATYLHFIFPVHIVYKSFNNAFDGGGKERFTVLNCFGCEITYVTRVVLAFRAAFKFSFHLCNVCVVKSPTIVMLLHI